MRNKENSFRTVFERKARSQNYEIAFGNVFFCLVEVTVHK